MRKFKIGELNGLTKSELIKHIIELNGVVDRFQIDAREIRRIAERFGHNQLNLK